MQHVIRQFMPDDQGGNGNLENITLAGNATSSSNLNDGDDRGNTNPDATASSGTTGSPLTDADDDLGDAGLGVANIDNSANRDIDDGVGYTAGDNSPGDISNLIEIDRTSDMDDDLDITDIKNTDRMNVGAGGDLNSPGIGTLDDMKARNSGPVDANDDEPVGNTSGNEVVTQDVGTIVDSNLGGGGVLAGINNDLNQSTEANTGSTNDVNIDPDLTQSAPDQQPQSTGNRMAPQQTGMPIARMALIIGVALLGGWWLLSRSRKNGNQASVYDQVDEDLDRYQDKAGEVKQSVKRMVGDATPLDGESSVKVSVLDSVIDSVKGTYHNAKAVVEEALA